MADRIVLVEIGGKKYPLNFSISAYCYAEENFESVKKLGELLCSEPVYRLASKLAGLAAEMIRAGVSYTRMTGGEEQYSTITEEQVGVLICPAEAMEFVGAVRDAIAAGLIREVEAKPPKKGKAASEK